MTTIALIGADGAGKTTIAQRVAERSNGRIQYVYLGMNAQSNRFALPTSRLALAWKRKRYERTHGSAESGQSESPDLGHMKASPNPITGALRLVNRLLEEWFRWGIVRRIQRKGQMVICDRHFVLDHALAMIMGKPNRGRMSERIHRWTLFRFYPRPDLVLFLDAPAEVLYERKRDAPLEYLETRQREYREATRSLANFIRVDGAQDIGAVIEDVEHQIAQFAGHAPDMTNRT